MLGQVIPHPQVTTLKTVRQPQLLPPAHSCTPAKGAVCHLFLKGGILTSPSLPSVCPCRSSKGGASNSKFSITAENLANCRNMPRIHTLATFVAWPHGHLHSFPSAQEARPKQLRVLPPCLPIVCVRNLNPMATLPSTHTIQAVWEMPQEGCWSELN